MDVMVFPDNQPTCVVEQHWYARKPQELAGCLDVAFENGVSGPRKEVCSLLVLRQRASRQGRAARKSRDWLTYALSQLFRRACPKPLAQLHHCVGLGLRPVMGEFAAGGPAQSGRRRVTGSDEANRRVERVAAVQGRVREL